MHGWWIAMGIFAAACLALGPTYNHHRKRRAERARLNLAWPQVEAWLSAPQAPDGTILESPTEDTPTPRGVRAVRPKHRVAPSDAAVLGATLSPEELS